MRIFAHTRLLLIVTLTMITVTIWSLLTYAQPVSAASFTFIVDTTVDSATLIACSAAPDDCSLRGAIIAANSNTQNASKSYSTSRIQRVINAIVHPYGSPISQLRPIYDRLLHIAHISIRLTAT